MQTAKRTRAVVTSPHSGHFMTSNLDEEEDYSDSGEPGLSIDPSTHDHGQIPFDLDKTVRNDGYNFAGACQKPSETYYFDGGKLRDRKPDAKDFDSSLSKLFACMSIAYRLAHEILILIVMKGLKRMY